MGSVSAGTVVGGKYRLEEPIGRGGMASVWRATHTTLESSVAVKFLETFGTSREKMAKRFLREARLAGGLKHRHVVHILDYGVMDDGQPFMVMELLEGTSLADRFENGPPLPEVELFEIVAKVLSGLAAVHDAGIVHRDVKPDNVFLVRDSDGDYPKLLDFGISRGVQAEAGDTRVTNTGAVIGTPLYMSPEQARGMNDLDQRTDLWSVGMILWEGLCGGELPFEAEHMGDVLIRIATEDAPSIALSRPDLPPEAVEVISRVLQRDRSARFKDAREMRDAVRKAADVLAAAEGTLRRRTPASSTSLPAVANQKDVATREVPLVASKPRRWPLVAGGAAVATLVSVVVAFIALGGEIRFSSAAAEPEPRTDAPPSAPIDPPAEPRVQEPSVATAEPEAPPAPEPEPPEPEPAVTDTAETATPEPAPPRSRVRPTRPRDRERGGERAGQSPSPREATPETPRPRGGQTQEGSGGFLRDLDY